MKKLLSNVLILLLILQSFSVYGLNLSSEGDSFKDIENHWAKDTIERHREMGMLKGYPDGTFKPDEHMKKSELITLVNRYFGLEDKSDKKFNDVDSGEWYASEAAKAKYYYYIEDLNLNPEEDATKEDVIKIMAMIIDVDKEKADEKTFTDLGSVDKETRKNIELFAEMGYLGEAKDGKFNPKEKINRAQILTVVDHTLGYIVRSQSDVKNIPADAKKVTIIGSDITIDNMNINGDILISPGVKGDVKLRNVIVKGEIDISGGSESKPVTLENVTAKKVLITKSKYEPKVEIKGSSKINEVKTKTSSEVDLEGTSRVFKTDTKAKTKLVLKDSSKIIKLEIESETKVDTGKNSEISQLDAMSDTIINGEGHIKKAIIDTEHVSIDKKPDFTEVTKNVLDVKIAGKTVTQKNDDRKEIVTSSSSTSNKKKKKDRPSSSGSITPPTPEPPEPKPEPAKPEEGDSYQKFPEDEKGGTVTIAWIPREDIDIASYELYYWEDTSIDTLSEVKSEATLVKSYDDKVLEGEVGITEDRLYMFSVIEKDSEGKEILYKPCKAFVGGLISISKVEDLFRIGREASYPVNGSNSSYMLMNNIDFNSDESYHNPNSIEFGDINEDGKTEGIKIELSSGKGWIMAESTGDEYSWPFSGYFNGNGYTISNLYSSGREVENGLFTYIQDGTVCNLKISNALIESNQTLGLLSVGARRGTIFNITLESNEIIGTGDLNFGAYVGNLLATDDGSDISNITLKNNTMDKVPGIPGGLIGYIKLGKIKDIYVENHIMYSSNGGIIAGDIDSPHSGNELSNIKIVDSSVSNIREGAAIALRIKGNEENKININNVDIDVDCEYIYHKFGKGATFAYGIENANIDNILVKGSVSQSMASGFSHYALNSYLSNISVESILDTENSRAGIVHALINSKLESSYYYSDYEYEKALTDCGLILDAANSEIVNCYNIRNIEAGEMAAGLVGRIYHSTLSNCYFNGNILSDKKTAGGVDEINESASWVSYGPDSYEVNRTESSSINDIIVFGNLIELKAIPDGEMDFVGRIIRDDDRIENIANLYGCTNMLVKDTRGQMVRLADENGRWGGNVEAISDSTKTFFDNWDFESVWEIKEGANRPTLQGVGNDDGDLINPLPEEVPGELSASEMPPMFMMKMIAPESAVEEVPSTEKTAVVEEESSSTEKIAVVEGESSSTEKTTVVEGESSSTEEAPAIEKESSLTEETPSVEEEVPSSEEAPSVEEEASSSEETPSVEEEVPSSEETPSVEDEVPSSEETPSVEEEVPSSEEAPSVEEEASSSEETPSVEEEVPSSEEAPSVEEEASSSEETPSVEEEVPSSEETPSVEEEVPSSEEAPSVEEEASSSEETPAVEEEASSEETIAVEEEEPSVEESSSTGEE